MKNKLFLLLLILLLVITPTSCGPSEEAIATMTAAAWTPTPLPTATPTPVPYAVDLAVADEEANPLPFAKVVVQEMGEDYYEVDDIGTVGFKDLPGETVTLDVTAPGYLPAQVSETVERGDNDMVVVLKQDPGGYLPGQACRAEETLLYIEDFQDGLAQGWGPIMASIDYNAPGWSIEPDSENADNQILIAANNSSFSNSDYDELSEPFTNAVWRIKVKLENTDTDMFLNWLHAPTDGGEHRFTLQFGGPAQVDLGRLQMPDAGHFSVGGAGKRLKENQWYDFEISTFDATTEVWIDGTKWISYTDPKPFSGGTIGIEVHLFEGSQSIYYFDDIAVCSLNAPFETIYTAE
jgi:hypothetical protein